MFVDQVHTSCVQKLKNEGMKARIQIKCYWNISSAKMTLSGTFLKAASMYHCLGQNKIVSDRAVEIS